MKHTHKSSPVTGHIEHITGDEWRTAFGRTHIALIRDDALGDKLQFRLVVCDHVDFERCKFWIDGDLSILKGFIGAIDELIKQAEKKSIK